MQADGSKLAFVILIPLLPFDIAEKIKLANQTARLAYVLKGSLVFQTPALRKAGDRYLPLLKMTQH